ncbi:MAG: hypothetical protein JWM76_2868 [Pseudonocardiales bacterium]|nr:hypothetical protein [Pseudonocardiales bacterium]
MTEQSGLSLYDGMQLSGMTFYDLWVRQITVGGAADELAVEAYTLGLLIPDPLEHNILAQAVNEHFLERGQDHPVAYMGSANAP